MKNNLEGQNKPKVFIAIVNEIEIAVSKPKLTGAELLKEAGFKHLQCYTLYQKMKGCDFEKISFDEVVDLSDPGVERFVTKNAEIFNYEVDGEPETTESKSLTAEQILKLKGLDPQSVYLLQVVKDGDDINYAYCSEEPIKMDCRGMIFKSHKWKDVVDIEEYGKQCKEVPPARIYKIKVDKKYHDWESRFITVQELIKLEYPSSSAQFEVYKFLNTSPKPIKLSAEEKVDLTEKCLVRFTIQPKEQTDGLQAASVDVAEELPLRREFSLPEEDVDFLDNLGLPWEAIGLNSTMWLLIHDFKAPEGYHQNTVTVALMIAPTYPATEIDMAYFFPSLTKISGRGINALSFQSIDGKTFQRWSRHRQPGQWRAGIDNIASHLCLVENWLIKDLGR